jgi:hypothetical protein
MWSLYIFGDNVEDRLGPFGTGVLLLCGLLSGLSHLFLNLYSNMPTIGASGAMQGLWRIFYSLSGARILTLIPIFIIPYFMRFRFFLPRILVLTSVPECGGKPRGYLRNRVVGTYRRLYFWNHILKLFLVFPNRSQ